MIYVAPWIGDDEKVDRQGVALTEKFDRQAAALNPWLDSINVRLDILIDALSGHIREDDS